MKMKIMLFGISNVGKTTIGKVLAKNLDYPFYDLAEEIRKKLNLTQDQFMEKYSDDYERGQLKCDFLKDILHDSKNCVIAVSPFNYSEFILPFLNVQDILPIELQDSPDHVFERLVFADENDVIYKDDEYKNKHKDYYLTELIRDCYYYYKIYEDIPSKYFIDNKSIEDAAADLTDCILNHKPIEIKLNLNKIVDKILSTDENDMCYYNIISHQMLYHNSSDIYSDSFMDLALNADIFIQIPTIEDFNVFGVFDDFVETIEDKQLRDKIINYTENSLSDFYDDLTHFGLGEEWDEFQYNACRNLAIRWCKENNIKYY